MPRGLQDHRHPLPVLGGDVTQTQQLTSCRATLTANRWQPGATGSHGARAPVVTEGHDTRDYSPNRVAGRLHAAATHGDPP